MYKLECYLHFILKSANMAINKSGRFVCRPNSVKAKSAQFLDHNLGDVGLVLGNGTTAVIPNCLKFYENRISYDLV